MASPCLILEKKNIQLGTFFVRKTYFLLNGHILLFWIFLKFAVILIYPSTISLHLVVVWYMPNVKTTFLFAFF